ncbi:MAG: glycine--tRNA ligase subunit beta [Simkaniaceae bacterium]
MITFQDLIFKLITFWGNKGCLFQQGYDVEVGAGTFNPATFLRSLGPEPYNSVYIEPSRRPQDGRYGENPNRTQLFHQLQVIMKPSPKNIQELYLDSLKEIGFDLKKHDVRFVHDDWESPTLGAWGLGWEVWIDGMEVTQFTYFQQMAGFPLHPIPVELTYGLERLCMFIQKVDNFFDMKYNEQLTYGDLYYKNEVEWSQYNFQASNHEMWLRHFNDYEKESESLIEKKLPIPAYDFVMKASHAFNMLEAKGCISVTERTAYIHRIRKLAHKAAKAYLEDRKDSRFPLLQLNKKEPEVKSQPLVKKEFDKKKKEDFLLEIGVEELPAAYISKALRSFETEMKSLLNELSLPFDSIRTFGTPRRLALYVSGLVDGKPEEIQERRGPPLSVCFDEKGAPTKQGIGFFQSLKLDPLHLNELKNNGIISIKDGYLFAQTKIEGQSTQSLLSSSLELLLTKISFPKKMRWGSLEASFARPIHWIVALFGSDVVPFEFAQVQSGLTTFGHRQLGEKKVQLKKSQDYLPHLMEAKVCVDIESRKEMILAGLKNLEEAHSFKVLEKERVLKEVLFLTEWPQTFLFNFDASFLRAPDEVLISEMIEHQRYFPVADQQGALLPHFVMTLDNTPNETIAKNNLSVLSARLTDGLFLYENDLKTSLKGFSEKLKTITFQKELGSLYEKSIRLSKISTSLAEELSIGCKEKVLKAALYSKADLSSELVKEFPELQGVIGKHYALYEKMDEEVALAIEEHYLPKSEKDALPKSEVGMIVSLSDKLDNLVGYFSINLKPKSSSDPYAMRRQSIAIIKILIENKLPLDLGRFLFKVMENFPKLKGHVKAQELLQKELLDFITARMKSTLLDYGFKNDEIEASIRGECTNPFDQYLKTEALNRFRSSDVFTKLFEVYKRARGQLENQPSFTFDSKLAKEPQELEVVKTLDDIKEKWQEAHASQNYEEAFSLLSTFKTPLANLFDHVKILDSDQKIKENRLALLQKVFSHFDALLDFSKIQKL